MREFHAIFRFRGRKFHGTNVPVTGGFAQLSLHVTCCSDRDEAVLTTAAGEQVFLCLYRLKLAAVVTARCTLVQSAVLRSHVVSPFVRPSVCDVGEL